MVSNRFHDKEFGICICIFVPVVLCILLHIVIAITILFILGGNNNSSSNNYTILDYQ